MNIVRWVIAFIICVAVYMSVHSHNENVSREVKRIVYSNEDLVLLRKTVQSYLPAQQVPVFYEQSNPLLYNQMEKVREGYVLHLTNATPIYAKRDGIILYTGHTTDFGKMVTISYDDGYTVSYGLLTDILKLPYSSIKVGDVLGVANEEQLYVKVFYNEQMLTAEQMQQWLNDD